MKFIVSYWNLGSILLWMDQLLEQVPMLNVCLMLLCGSHHNILSLEQIWCGLFGLKYGSVASIHSSTEGTKHLENRCTIFAAASDVYKNQYHRRHRGCTLMLSLYKLTGTDGQAGRRAEVSIGMHSHPKILFLN